MQMPWQPQLEAVITSFSKWRKLVSDSCWFIMQIVIQLNLACEGPGSIMLMLLSKLDQARIPSLALAPLHALGAAWSGTGLEHEYQSQH